MSENQQPQQNPADVGAIWIKTGKNEQNLLSIGLEGKNYTGFKNDRKTEGSKQPDYNICEYVDGKPVRVGAAWTGKSGQGRDKLSMKFGDGEDARFYTAVMRDGAEEFTEDSKQAHMTILKSTPAEELEAATADAEAVAESAPAAEKKKGVSL